MKIQLEDKNKLICLIPGYCQLAVNEPFTPCALGLIEGELIIYNDFGPDEIHSDAYIYRVKKRIPLEGIQTILNQKIKKNKELDCFNRFNIIAKVVEESCFIYYRKSDVAIAKRMLKRIKSQGVRIKSLSVNLAPNS